MAGAAERYDVVVVGGGAAGVAAACGAASQGARTLLVERYGFLGGAATVSSVCSYCGFYTRGPEPVRVVAGIGDEVLSELRSLGLDTSPYRSPSSGNWIVLFDPEALKIALEQLLSKYNVELRLHAQLGGVVRHADVIEGITLVDDSGLEDVVAGGLVDASGEANLVAAAHGQFDQRPDGVPYQAASMPVRIGGVAANVPLGRHLFASAITETEAGQGRATRKDGGIVVRLPRSNEIWWLAIDVEVNGLDSKAVTIAEQECRARAWAYVDWLRRNAPGFEGSYVSSTGPRLGIRETRHPATLERVTETDALGGRMRDDAIACAGWPMEVHSSPSKPRYSEIGGDGYFQVPIGALRPQRIRNLWLGGRTIGCDLLAYGSIRVMGTAFATGHAAGIAAAQQADANEISLANIRRSLIEAGAII